ncbi:MAG: flagella basal body P-ring formation protein FlgA, partial [Alphaproteobacteria bacterium]
ADVVTDPSDIVGLSPRRPQLAGRVLRRVEFAAPIAVKKGTLVTLMLRQGALLLTTQGRALEDGAIGDTIRVQNTDSKQTIAGAVSAPGIVAVRSRSLGRLAAIDGYNGYK